MRLTKEQLINVVAAVIAIGFLACVMYLIYTANKTSTLAFMNKSSHGYYYDTDNLRFASKNDRTIAVNVLFDMLQQDGTSYTQDQLARLSDSFVLTILDAEDDTELDALKSQLSILVDPTYKTVYAAVIYARRNLSRFANDSARQLTFDLLIKFFSVAKTPITVPMARWPDALIIRTFSSLRLPSDKDYLPVRNLKV